MQNKEEQEEDEPTSPATDSPSSAAKTRSEAKQRRRLRRRRLSHPGWRIWSAARRSSCVRTRLGRGRTVFNRRDDSRGGVRRLVVNGGSTRRWRLDQRWCTARDGRIWRRPVGPRRRDGGSLIQTVVTHGSGPAK
ncbi:hypothetical protein M6B38_377830 [Iris pallida]|uniref:Uncharacterized protein n=1 Tax=Iris pallida TaxID=29817 RepID=A0AAX6GAT6_IRIPA|nr:hypothetical protein M6B38_377830 [Iris pallida]